MAATPLTSSSRRVKLLVHNIFLRSDPGHRSPTPVSPWYPDPRSNKQKTSELTAPSKVLTFIDSHPQTGDGAVFVIRIKEAAVDGIDAWAARPGEQHRLGANVAFADGHVTRWAWRWSRKILIGSPGVPVNAADGADFQLVKDHWPWP